MPFLLKNRSLMKILTCKCGPMFHFESIYKNLIQIDPPQCIVLRKCEITKLNRPILIAFAKKRILNCDTPKENVEKYFDRPSNTKHFGRLESKLK